MSNKLLIVIGIIFVIAFILIKLNSINNKYNNQLELKYKTNGGVPFKWEYEIEDKSVVLFVKSVEIENQNKNNIVGGPIIIKYIFKGLKPGQTTITFKYINFTNGQIVEEEKNIVKVDKNNNIILIKKIRNN